MSYSSIENSINEIKEFNQEAGNILHSQMHALSNAKYTRDEASEYLKETKDAADMFCDDDSYLHAEVREIQDEMIAFFAV